MSTFMALILTTSTFLVALPITGGATPTPTSNEPQANQPQTVGGSTNYQTAPTIQFNATGGFYGIYNAKIGRAHV